MRSFFLPISINSYLFANYYPASGQSRKAVLVFPPFAEEMNRCRRIVHMQCEQFAQSGCDVLSIDLSCTGDSQGRFEEASWQEWLNDVRVAYDWLNRMSPAQHTVFWGIRYGARLLVDFLINEGIDQAQVYLWQAEFDGKQIIQQMKQGEALSDVFAKKKADAQQDVVEGPPCLLGYQFSQRLWLNMKSKLCPDLYGLNLTSLVHFQLARHVSKMTAEAFGQIEYDQCFNQFVMLQKPFWVQEMAPDVPELRQFFTQQVNA